MSKTQIIDDTSQNAVKRKSSISKFVQGIKDSLTSQKEKVKFEQARSLDG